ncbi:unnamed protein product [Linum tenue]|uniref:S-protein homolog n=1 Tax=Linum tenue TaxID=586396 RepID=A0AAV0IB26_9ROSI|nr:unnamed protein product [Linum tenue]
MAPKALLAAVVFATVLLHIATAERGTTIYVNNKLSRKITVIAHCKSKDDDLHAHAIEAGTTYTWSFDQNWFGGTFFWCNLAVEDKRLSFTAFEQDDHSTYMDSYDVLDRGVYAVDRDSGEWLHLARWNVTR